MPKGVAAVSDVLNNHEVFTTMTSSPALVKSRIKIQVAIATQSALRFACQGSAAAFFPTTLPESTDNSWSSPALPCAGSASSP